MVVADWHDGVFWLAVAAVLACPGPGQDLPGEDAESTATDPGLDESTGPVPTSAPPTTGNLTTATGSGEPDSGSAGGPPAEAMRFAVIGDFGDNFVTVLGLGGEDLVAALVTGWTPDFILTVGDNNYPDGAAATIDNNIGKYYSGYIGSYAGAFGEGSRQNRFWPTLGNHDWRDPDAAAHTDYFTLPGNERYYEVDLGLVHLFAVDSESAEPDGATADSVQGLWLQQAMAASTACWKIVFFHRPPYSSGDHGSSVRMQWPFEQWGADAVLAGHDHTFERLRVGAIPYFVNGLGGALRYPAADTIPESEIFYNQNWGAQLVTVTKSDITFEFITVGDELIDSYSVEKVC